MPAKATQGHTYLMDVHGAPVKVLSLENGPRVTVAELHLAELWPLGRKHQVDAELLTPQPMGYFHGEVPR